MSEEEDPGKLRIGRLFDAPVKSRLEQLLFDSNSDSGGQVTDASKPTFASPLLSHGGAVQLIAENSSASEKNFEWTPPNIDQQMVTTCPYITGRLVILSLIQVDNYMAALPEEARPIANSIGAVKRKEAIERQLPLYDHDETECHELTTDERQIMTKYVCNWFNRFV